MRKKSSSTTLPNKVNRSLLPWESGAIPEWSLKDELIEKSLDNSFTDDQLSKIASMAYISLPKNDAEQMQRLKLDMDSILRFTQNVSLQNISNDRTKVDDKVILLREDEIIEGEISDRILKNASKIVDNHFVVLKS